MCWGLGLKQVANYIIYNRQAYATRQDVSRQGRIIHGVNQRVGGIVSKCSFSFVVIYLRETNSD